MSLVRRFSAEQVRHVRERPDVETPRAYHRLIFDDRDLEHCKLC